MYDKLLKELKRGNAVLLHVDSSYRSSAKGEDERLRIVTPTSCDFIQIMTYDHYYGYCTNCYRRFVKSCFLEKNYGRVLFPKVLNKYLSPELIVYLMESFDKENDLKILDMVVL